MPNLLINRAFFGKDNAFKFMLTKDRECYFQVGKESGDEWKWKKAKMNDLELAEIYDFLRKEKEKVNFYHEFEGDKTQIWISRKNEYIFIKIEDYTKRLSLSEQVVLEKLIDHGIVRMNMEL